MQRDSLHSTNEPLYIDLKSVLRIADTNSRAVSKRRPRRARGGTIALRDLILLIVQIVSA